MDARMRRLLSMSLRACGAAILFAAAAIAPAAAEDGLTIEPKSATLCIDEGITLTAKLELEDFAPYFTWYDNNLKVKEGINERSLTRQYGPEGTGDHTILCEVRLRGGRTAQDSASLTVMAPRVNVTDIRTEPARPTLCDTVLFTASVQGGCGSTVPKGRWDFGDGDWQEAVGPDYKAAHAYPEPGSYTVRFTATVGPVSDSKTAMLQIEPGGPPGPVILREPLTEPRAVTLTWMAALRATRYVIYRFQQGEFRKIAATGATLFRDSGLTPGTEYLYRVCAENDCQPPEPSCAEQRATTLCEPVLRFRSVTVFPDGALMTGEKALFKADVTEECPSGNRKVVWQFGDGGQAEGEQVAHAYLDAGTYQITATATDPPASPVSKSLTVTVYAGIRRRLQPGASGSCGAPDPFTGNASWVITDPVDTRGYPLTCNIVVNTQAVDLNRPMANAAFTYDIHITQAPYYTQTFEPVQHLYVIDADGRRLDFGPVSGDPRPEAGVFSTLTRTRDGYSLEAGPPYALDGAGNFRYTFSGDGRLVLLEDEARNGQELTYAAGRLQRVTDRNTGKSITFGWGSGLTADLITRVVENGGLAQTAIEYQDGLATKVTHQDALGTPLTYTTFEYQNHMLDNVVQDGDPASKVWYTYTAWPATDGRSTVALANRHDGKDHSTLSWGQPVGAGAVDAVQATNNKGGRFLLEYDAQGDLIRVTSPARNGSTSPFVQEFDYDRRRVTASRIGGVTEAEFFWNNRGLMEKATDGAGHTWSWTYQGVDLISATDPSVGGMAARRSTWAYDDPNQPHFMTSATDPVQHTWLTTPNLFGQLLMATPPDGSPTAAGRIIYDETPGSPTLGYPLQSIDGNGDIVTFDRYDQLGDLTQVSTYPVHGDMTKPRTTWHGYDALQRLTEVTHADGKSVRAFYAGRFLDRTIDEAGTQYNYFYCPTCGSLEKITGPLGWSLGWSTDGDGDPIFFMDANGHRTDYVYGPGGDLRGVDYPDGTRLAISRYDRFGRVQEAQNGRGQTVVSGYDDADRLKEMSFPTSGAPSLGFEYNEDDTLKSVTDGTGTTTYTYTPEGLVWTVAYRYNGLAPVQTLTYAYYPDGSRKNLTWTSGGVVVGSWSYLYDPGGRLTGVQNSWDETTTWSYDGESKLTDQNNANGTSVHYGFYAPRAWPNAMTCSNASGIFASYALTYDLGANTVGNLTDVTEQGSGSVAYRYDALSRLKSEARRGANANSHSFDYDLAGNRTNVDGMAFDYDAANKLKTVPGLTVAHDNDGNVTSFRASVTLNGRFDWDDRSLLTKSYAGVGDLNLEYGYNAFGQRVLRAQDGILPARLTFYIFDGGVLLGEIESINGVSTTKAAYTWGAAGLVSERLVDQNKSLWYAFGPQGETRQLTDRTGAVVDRYVYTAYGVPVSETNNNPNPFRYGGQFGYYSEEGSNAGLILCGARWYCPTLGRWLSRDPDGYGGGPNLYEYCWNSPVHFQDPFGMSGLPWWINLPAGLAGELLFPGPGGPIMIGLAEGIWAYAVEGKSIEESLGIALQSGVEAAIGGQLMKSFLGALARSSFVQKMIQRVGCKAKGLLGSFIRRLSNKGCFLEGTPVLRIDSLDSAPIVTAIEEIQAGDLVVSRNPDTGKTGINRVTSVSRRTVGEVVTLSLANAYTGDVVDRITTTPDHPFFVDGQGFVEAGSLGIGTQIVTRAGPSLVIVSAERQTQPGGYFVYNFEVEGAHSYFVGTANGGIWVHNNDCTIYWPNVPHTTGTPGHWFAIKRKAAMMVRSGEYEKIYLNRAINTATGLKLSPNRRPDIIGIRPDGKIDLFEIPSNSDKIALLKKRMDATLAQLGERAGDGKIVEIRKKR